MIDDKKLVWVGSARKAIQGFPQEVRAVFGVAL
jgi:phage-related protein